MSAQKKVRLDSEMLMLPRCHPANKMEVLYTPERGGDAIVIKCEVCYRIFFKVKLPKEDES